MKIQTWVCVCLYINRAHDGGRKLSLVGFGKLQKNIMLETLPITINILKDNDEMSKQVRNILIKIFKVNSNDLEINNINAYNYTNVLYHIINKNDTATQYLLRIYGNGTDKIIDKKLETKIAYRLGNELDSYAPRLYYIFENGRIEEFYQNVVIPDPMISFQRQDLISDELIKLHSYKLNSTDDNDPNIYINKLVNYSSISQMWKLYNLQKNVDKSKYFYDNYIENEIEFLLKILPNENVLNSKINADNIIKYYYNNRYNNDIRIECLARIFMYQCVLSHNDVCVGNILYLQNSNELKFIDFEYSSYNFRGYDFATYFGVCNKHKFNKNDIPTKEQRIHFIKCYLNSLKNIKHSNDNTKYIDINKTKSFMNELKNDNEYNIFILKCDFIILEYMLLNCFIWGLWAINQYNFDACGDCDYLYYAFIRLNLQYNFIKNSLYKPYLMKCKL